MPELSVQLYTVRDALAKDYDQTLAQLAGFGFTRWSPSGWTLSRRSCGRARHPRANGANRARRTARR